MLSLVCVHVGLCLVALLLCTQVRNTLGGLEACVSLPRRSGRRLDPLAPAHGLSGTLAQEQGLTQNQNQNQSLITDHDQIPLTPPGQRPGDKQALRPRDACVVGE